MKEKKNFVKLYINTDEELKPVIQKIQKVVESENPALIWIFRDSFTFAGVVFHYRYNIEPGPFFPQKQISFNLDKKEVKRISAILGIGQIHYSYNRSYGRGYNEEHWWAETNIHGATWHDAVWRDECVGAEHIFIIANLPTGQHEDAVAAINEAQKKLELLLLGDKELERRKILWEIKDIQAILRKTRRLSQAQGVDLQIDLSDIEEKIETLKNKK